MSEVAGFHPKMQKKFQKSRTIIKNWKQIIDELSTTVESPQGFILPGDTLASAACINGTSHYPQGRTENSLNYSNRG
jgi:cob(I)alamin adenosyltransferase